MSNSPLSVSIAQAVTVFTKNLRDHFTSVSGQPHVPEKEKLALEYFLLKEGIHFFSRNQQSIETELLTNFNSNKELFEFIDGVCKRYART